MIDHNKHLGRVHSTNQAGEDRSHHRHRKRTKRWDVVPVLEKKTYPYFGALVEMLLDYHDSYETNIRDSQHKRSDHPEFISCTIAKSNPPPTKEIVSAKKSRFDNRLK